MDTNPLDQVYSDGLTISIPASTPAAASAPVLASDSLPSGYASSIAGHESAGNPKATNPLYPAEKGGPLGPHQFLASTWQSFAKANPTLFAGMTPDQVMNARTDPALSARATNWLAGENAPILQKHGIVPTPANLAIAHALGGAGAAGVLGLPDQTNLGDAIMQTQPGMGAQVLALNPRYKTMTVADLKNKYAGMDTGQYAAAAAPTTVAATTPDVAAPPTPTPTVAAIDPRMAQLQRVAMLNKLIQPQQQAAVPVNPSMPWQAAILNSGRNTTNPLQTVAQVQALRNGYSTNPLLYS